MPTNHLELAQKTASLFARLPQVEAVAMGGSRGSGANFSDSASDIDLYIYTRGDIALEERRAIMENTGGAIEANLGLNYWGPGDEWFNAPTGIEVDVVFFEADWIEDQISRVVEKHQASLGYTTCFWHTVRHSIIFHDPRGWFTNLQQRCMLEYPEPLLQNIIALNHPVLGKIIPAYANQIEKAVKRRDLISINHRLAALFASYFDILLAVNRQLHPGEKRLIEFVKNNCSKLPANMEQEIASILLLSEPEIPELPARVTSLIKHLDQLLKMEGCLPTKSQQ